MAFNNPERKMTKAYIGATFDLPHYGHMRLIQRARNIADIVIVCLNTDEFVERFKGHKPLMSLAERHEAVRGLKGVDFVDVNLGGEDSKPSLLLHKPDFIIYGSDYDEGRYMEQIGVTRTWLAVQGMQLVQFPYTTEISTSEIKRRCLESSSFKSDSTTK